PVPIVLWILGRWATATIPTLSHRGRTKTDVHALPQVNERRNDPACTIPDPRLIGIAPWRSRSKVLAAGPGLRSKDAQIINPQTRRLAVSARSCSRSHHRGYLPPS